VERLAKKLRVRLRHLGSLLLLLAAVPATHMLDRQCTVTYGQQRPQPAKAIQSRKIRLSAAHVAATNRRRRIILQMDVGAGPFYSDAIGPTQLADAIDYHLSPIDQPKNQIDSVWWDWTEGNSASWPSQILPRQTAIFPKWSQAGIDPVGVLLDQTRRRGREVFFSYRVNGNDNGPGEFKLVRPNKEKHPERLIQAIYPFKHYWNFAFPEVRELKRSVVAEIATLYDFDGIQLDFARMPIMFPPGEQWSDRQHLTAFVRSVRMTLLEIEKKRGRPLLLAVRVPESVMGSHFDGYDVETWARDQLVDIFVLGNRSADVELGKFREITAKTGIKLYPSWDDYHASDGYRNAPVEVVRGVAANWWNQGADGIHLFNIGSPSPAALAKVGKMRVEGFSPEYLDQTRTLWKRQAQIFSEVGSTDSLRNRDKVFIVQRRGDNLGPPAWPKPTEWETPRHMYFGANMLSQLPAELSNGAKADSLVILEVADDMSNIGAAANVKEVTLRVVISDPEADRLPAGSRLEATVVGNYTRPGPDPTAMNKPPAKGIEGQIECRLNNLLLPSATVEQGWLVFKVDPRQLAVGDNLVGLRLTKPVVTGAEKVIERIELHITHRQS